jgi:HPt (histidine-containing phosphotransfer) domain-containing protein
MNFSELADQIGLEEEEYRELVELFIDTGGPDVDSIESDVAAGNAEQVARSAHTLCGAAGNLRIMTVHEVAKRIELAANQNRLDTVTDDVVTLKALFAELVSAVGA